MKHFCAADGGFYSLTFHGFIPDGCVEVSDEDYRALLAGQEQGKRIVAGDDGFPVLVDPLPPSDEALAAVERGWRDQRLSETDGVVARHRDELEGGGMPGVGGQGIDTPREFVTRWAPGNENNTEAYIAAIAKRLAVQCQPLPAPSAWFMEEREPNLTRRMLNELSPSPTPATKD
ncbi:hypothetical protein [Pseudomonas fluorescens]|uniref:hypothetical protein n=1 Tax=Pseudomonas fluorescens TaxID=294 RepID=UPI003D22C258